MSNSSPVDKIPLQFVFMCRHDTTGYFQRTDGRPLDISTMKGPTTPGVTYEPLDLQANPHVRPRILPLLELCPQCRFQREKTLMGGGKLSSKDPVGPYWAQAEMSRLRSQHATQDLNLMNQALGGDTRRVQDRVDGRLIVESSKNDHNDTHKDKKHEPKSWENLPIDRHDPPYPPFDRTIDWPELEIWERWRVCFLSNLQMRILQIRS